ILDLLLFFFSSRRRHTRWPRDWSSDVCSSDLVAPSDDASLVDQVDGRPEVIFPGVPDPIIRIEYHRPTDLLPDEVGLHVGGVPRSEERRIGKECRWRWWP